MWTIGIEFGTVGMRKGDQIFEITTYRSEQYAPNSRKPGRPVRHVAGGGPVPPGLHRQRDGRAAALACELVDPFGGLRDLRDKVLRTPGSPEDSFSDDPLRIMRAARFTAQLGFTVVTRGARGHDASWRPGWPSCRPSGSRPS